MDNSVNISIDIHGVIDDNPDSFRSLASCILATAENSVTIISGALPDTLLQRLQYYGMPHTRWVSVTQYLINRGYAWEYDEHRRPSFDPIVWEKAKGNIVRQINSIGPTLDAHIDDMAKYGEHFPDETLFILYERKPITYEILLERLASRSSQNNRLISQTV